MEITPIKVSDVPKKPSHGGRRLSDYCKRVLEMTEKGEECLKIECADDWEARSVTCSILRLRERFGAEVSVTKRKNVLYVINKECEK